MPEKILVVDDEPQLERLILQRFRKKIRSNDYTFVFAQDGQAALQQLRNHPDISLILSDINMPKMDGLTLLTRLNEFQLLLKTVMVSAYGDMKNIRTAMNRGAYDFVTKPIDFEDLEVTIEKALRDIENLRSANLAKEELSHLHDELGVASQVQQSVLPRNFDDYPDGSAVSIFAEMIPAKDVGGDFYDFFRIDEKRIGIVIADVSGKGMPAALFMAISRTFLKSIALRGKAADVCLTEVNHLLSQDNPKSMFVTLFYAIFDTETGLLHFANAGHNSPALITADGSLQFINKGRKPALCVIGDMQYSSAHLTLEKGSSLILYTDGITEAMDHDRNEYGEERLQGYLQNHGTASPRQLITGLLSEIETFTDAAPQSDDITILAMKYS